MIFFHALCHLYIIKLSAHLRQITPSKMMSACSHLIQLECFNLSKNLIGLIIEIFQLFKKKLRCVNNTRLNLNNTPFFKKTSRDITIHILH